MSTKITSKQVKIIDKVNFNNKEIENAKIDANKNQITNLPIGGNVDDVLVNGQSVVSNKEANINIKTINGESVVGTGNIKINASARNFVDEGITKTTSRDTMIDLAQEIESKEFPVGTTLFGEIENSGMPFVGNAEVRVDILDEKDDGDQVILFTLYSTNVAPYEWEWRYYLSQTVTWLPKAIPTDDYTSSATTTVPTSKALHDGLETKQDKLVAGENITIDTEGNYWTDFGGENNNNLQLLNAIPNFSSIRIIFKASSYDLSFDDNTLLCRQDTEIYFGVQDDSHSPSIWTGDHWIVGQEQIEEKTNYWFCLDSSDGQTFTYYTIEDNNYTLNTLPQLSEWVEQCNINENFLSGEIFYIGYNPFSQGEYWKGRLFECQIIIDNQEWFNLQTAEEGVDYENNGCEYVGELTNPIISAKNTEYKQSFNIAVKDWEDNRIEFKGYHYQVYDYTNLNIEYNELVVDCIVSENSLVFRNGQLLRQGSDYDYNATMWYQDGLAAKFRSYADLENWGVHDLPEGCVVKVLHDENHDYETTYYEWQIENDSGSWVYLEDGFNDEPRFCTYLYNFKAALSQDDNIKIINGLHAQHFTGITGTVVDTGHYVQINMIVLRNGILLCGENSWEPDQDNENAIRLGTPLNENETLTIIPNYNLRLMFTEGIAEFENDRRTLNVGTNLPGREVLVWKDTLLQTLDEDYREEGEKIIFNEKIENDNVFVQVSIPQENSIYNAIGDKGTGEQKQEGKDITTVHYFGYNDTIDEDHKIIDTDITFADSVYVYRNGVLLRDTLDYTIEAGSKEIEFEVAIVITDTITVVNGNVSGIDMTRYLTYNSTATISNKTISADNNEIENLEIDNFKNGVVQNTVRDSATATNNNLVTEKAVRDELDTKQDTLIAGNGILINGNVISSSGESSTGFVTWYDNNNFVAGDTEIQTQMATIHKVFRNGVLLRDGNGKDYTTELVNGAAKITFSIALLDTDEIAVE